jgi:hypothetical protein
MAKFVRAAQLIRQFKQSATPTVAQGLTVDDIWVDTDDHTTYVCTSVSPVTFQSIGSGGTPGGSDTQVQFNDGGSFGGDSGLTFNKTTNALTATTFIGALTGNASTVTNGVYTTDSGTVTNTMLAGSIANNKLSNSSITINGSSVSLGGSTTVTESKDTLIPKVDFLVSASAADNICTQLTSGSGAASTLTNSVFTDGSAVGVVTWNTGTTTTGYGGHAHSSAGTTVYIGSGTDTWEGRIRIPVLSSATDIYNIMHGFTDSVSENCTNGVWMDYTHSVNSGNWTIKYNVAGGGVVTTNCNAGPSANTWYRLRLEVTSSGATAYVNGVSIGSVSASMPTAVVRANTAIIKNGGSTGTTAMLTYCDYLQYGKTYTTPR